MKIIFLLEDILHRIVYFIFARIIEPRTEQEAEALSKLTYSILFDPLNITKKDKQS